MERCPPQGRRCPGPAVTPDRQENSERSPRVWIDVELGATIGSPAGSIEVLQAFRNVIGPPTENDDRLAARRQRTHYEGAHTEYEAVMQSIFRAVGSDRPAGRSPAERERSRQRRPAIGAARRSRGSACAIAAREA